MTAYIMKYIVHTYVLAYCLILLDLFSGKEESSEHKKKFPGFSGPAESSITLVPWQFVMFLKTSPVALWTS